MHVFIKGLSASFACAFLVSAAVAADTSRVMTPTGERANRVTNVSRMPYIPVLPVNAVGNVAVDEDDGGQSSKPTPTPDPTPKPDPEPQPEPQPEPKPECPDGGVRNSEYGVANCMNDVLACINNGALSGGLNDLFNEDMRNAIVNGMGLCSIQVDKCMMSVRRDCKPVYRSIADVWVDFNSRKVQPEYYNFVLRKTGLTPNQAENTCMLLDKNTYGPSFAAVANSGATTAEYNNQVGAYNRQMGNVLIKANPVGPQVNDGNPGVDGVRGHYARWDATTGTCYLRVAAYNKDEPIKNSWLFGALGNDEMAEVWRAAGDTFSCNKDLFGFSLMNDTKTTAVVGVGGGTLLGAGIGAMAGHGKRAFDCNNLSARKELMKRIRNNGVSGTINEFLGYTAIVGGDDAVSYDVCEELMGWYDGYEEVEESLSISCTGYKNLDDCFNTSDITKVCVGRNFKRVKDCANFIKQQSLAGVDINNKYLDEIFGNVSNKDSLAYLILNGEKSTLPGSIATGAAIGAGTGGLATAITAFIEKNNINCRVGDGLNTVAYGKSHSIDTLKDFYVKWNLRLPDTVSPTATAVDCKSWKLSCAEYTDLNQCKSAALNYKPNVDGTITLIHSACAVSGSVCIENAAVAKSYGACEE